MTDSSSQPQLCMFLPSLADLPEVSLPDGYFLRHFHPGDEAFWEEIISKTFDRPREAIVFDDWMRKDGSFRLERIFFITRGDVPVATASAWFRPEYGEETGYLHMVGVLAEERGLGLGKQISLAALHRMKEEGRISAVLQTDDFRIPAIKVYLRLGFGPRLSHESHQERWRIIFERIGGQ